MNNKIKECYSNLPLENKELARFVAHLDEALSKIEEEHRRIVAVDALAGIKPNRDEELVFRDTIHTVRKALISELEKTVEDIHHRGDKYWIKNYKDGII